jgi:hypothetical protein
MSIGLWIGIPLAIASTIVIMYVVRALLLAADKPGLSPTVISVTLLVGLMLLLYAGKPDELAALGDLVGVGLGGLVGILVGGRTDLPGNSSLVDEAMEAPNPAYEQDLTEPVPDSEGIPPEDVFVPEDIEELGKDAQ